LRATTSANSTSRWPIFYSIMAILENLVVFGIPEELVDAGHSMYWPVDTSD